MEDGGLLCKEIERYLFMLVIAGLHAVALMFLQHAQALPSAGLLLLGVMRRNYHYGYEAGDSSEDDEWN